ncbi:MAG: DUF4304 domain-containing protein [Erysipelotrichia bacterium]|nr:DUF4304 domain-containing protein [Erysipelotrichia bacterium]
MDKKEFKKALGNILKPYGFKYLKKNYYLSNDELIVVIATQKSNYDDSYYVNYDFLIKQINTEIEYPKDNVCDVTGRFVFNSDGKTIHTFNIEENNLHELEEGINDKLNSTIMPVLEKGLQEYYKMFPEYIVTATLKTKKYLGLEEQ